MAMKIFTQDSEVIERLLDELIKERTLYKGDHVDKLPEGEAQWHRICLLFIENNSAEFGQNGDTAYQIYSTEYAPYHYKSGLYKELIREQMQKEEAAKLEAAYKTKAIANMKRTRIISYISLVIALGSLLGAICLR